MKIGLVTLSITPAFVTRLSQALQAQTRLPDHAVLIANTRRVLAAASENPAWDQVLPGSNISFSACNNDGVRALPDDVTHVLLMNDDMIPYPNFIEEMERGLEHGDVVGGLYINRDGTVNFAGGGYFNLEIARAGHAMHIGRGEIAAEVKPEIATVGWVTFASVLMSRDLWVELGGLDESYVFSYEDHDMCLRAVNAGYKVVCNRGAVAIHEECGTRPKNGARDVTNHATFVSRWGGDTIETLLKAYHAKHPEVVGIPWLA